MEKQWRTWMQYIHMQIIFNSQLVFLMTLLLFIEVNASGHSYMSLSYTSI